MEGCDRAAAGDAESKDGEAGGRGEAVSVPRLLQPGYWGPGARLCQARCQQQWNKYGCVCLDLCAQYA